MNQPWTNHGPTVNQPWTNHEPTITNYQLWTNYEPTMNQPWTNHEPTMNQLTPTTNFEPTITNHEPTTNQPPTNHLPSIVNYQPWTNCRPTITNYHQLTPTIANCEPTMNQPWTNHEPTMNQPCPTQEWMNLNVTWILQQLQNLPWRILAHGNFDNRNVQIKASWSNKIQTWIQNSAIGEFSNCQLANSSQVPLSTSLNSAQPICASKSVWFAFCGNFAIWYFSLFCHLLILPHDNLAICKFCFCLLQFLPFANFIIY